MKNENKAIEFLNKMIELKPNSIKLLMSRAISYRKIKKYDEAFKDYERY